MQFFVSLLSLSMATLAMATSCSTPDGPGTCMATSSCGGFSVPGYCPGATNIQCCVSKSCSTPSGSGVCKSTSSCGGKSVSGYCPGPSSIQCCVAASSGSGGSCNTPFGSGTCKSTSSCGGFSVAGYCPGGADNQCCLSKSCSTSKGSGTCKNTSKGCSGGGFIAGACPGDSSVECCVPGAPSGGGGGNLPTLSATQSAHARAIIAEAKKEGLGHQGCLAGITTGLTESSLLVLANSNVAASFNYPHDGVGSDHDSVGIFQQRVMYYPNIAADMDPAESAAQFFAIMKRISGWQTMNVGTLCQEVQRSADPGAYGEHLAAAQSICSAGGD